MAKEPLTLAAAALVLAVYGAALAAMPRDVFWSPDEGAKYVQLETVKWDRGLTYRLPYRGRRLDPDFEFYASRCRHDDVYPAPTKEGVRFHWPLWFPLVSRGLLDLFGPTGLYVLPVLAGWMTAVATGALVRPVAPTLVPIAIVLTGLATPVFFYSLCFWEHTLATLLGTLALIGLVGSESSRSRLRRLSLPILLVAVVLRIEMLAFAAALLVTWLLLGWRTPATVMGRASARRLFSRRTIAAALVAVALILVALPPRQREYLQLIPELLAGNAMKLPFLPDALVSILVNSPGHQGPVIDRIWELVELGAFGCTVAAAWASSPLVEALLLLPGLLVLFDFSAYLALAHAPYISLHGIVPVAPYIAVGSYALLHAWRERDRRLLALTAAGASYFLLGFAAIFSLWYSREGTYQTGLEWGARNVLTLYPVGAAASLLAVVIYRRSARPRWLKNAFTALVVALMAVSAQLQLRGFEMLQQSKRAIAAWQKAIPVDQPIVTDLWWLPAAVAPFYIEHEVYCVRDRSELPDWLAVAERHGVEGFTFLTFRPLEPATPLDGFVVSAEKVAEGLRITRFRFSPGVPGSLG